MAKSFKDIYWYLEKVGGREVFNFDTHEQAKQFGDGIRELDLAGVEVDIRLTTVQLKITEESTINVGRGNRIK